MNSEDQMRKISKIIAKAWMDQGFKGQLLANPTARLKEEGVDIPAGHEIRIVEDTDKVHHLVLPPKPSPEEMSETALLQTHLFRQTGPPAFRACDCGFSTVIVISDR